MSTFGYICYKITNIGSKEASTTTRRQEVYYMDGLLIKIIDSLHVKNHSDPTCQHLYHLSQVLTEESSMNTMSCEQTFAWLSR